MQNDNENSVIHLTVAKDFAEQLRLDDSHDFMMRLCALESAIPVITAKP